MLDVAKKTLRTLISVRINTQLLERLDGHAEQVGRTRSELIDRAIEEYLERIAADAKPKGKPKT